MTILTLNPQLEYKFLKKEINQSIQNTLDSGQYILGSNVNLFEKNFARFIGSKYCCGLSSGTDALICSLKSLGIKKNDEVITVSHTAVATVSSIVEVGAKPKFVDIKKENYLIDIHKIKKAISKRTKAIIFVHIYGYPSNFINSIKDLKKKNIKIIEDCSQAHGAKLKKRKVGTFGDIACFSFYPTKNISALGDAGAITTNNFSLYKKIKLFREYGWEKKNFSTIHGTNKRLDEIQAGILNIKLKYFNIFHKMRKKIATRYEKKIKNKLIILPEKKQFIEHANHLFVIRIKENKRNKLKKLLKNSGFNCMVHYHTPVHKQKAYKKFSNSMLKNTEEISKEILSLPVYPLLKKTDQNKIINIINKLK